MARGYQSYRGRQSAGARAVIILLVIILIAACAFIFAQQYIVYGDDGGIYLDLPYFGRLDLPTPSRADLPPEDEGPKEPAVQLVVDEPEPEPEAEPEPEPEDLFGEHHVVELAALPTDGAALTETLAEQGASGFLYTVRNNAGELFWASAAGQKEAVKGTEEETEKLRSLCGSEGVLAVARFNVLHDSYYAFANMKDAAICQNGNYGYVWYDNHSYHWLEPDKELARQYVTGLAVECAQLGFDELLLEELSYPTRGNLYKIDYSANTMTKTEALVQMLTDLRAALEPYGTKLSLYLTEELLMAGSEEVSGIDLAAMLPLVDGVYADVSSASAAQALLQAAVGEGEEAPVLVCLLAEPGMTENWCIPLG